MYMAFCYHLFLESKMFKNNDFLVYYISFIFQYLDQISMLEIDCQKKKLYHFVVLVILH
jgi:hypothetical protein